ncbi:FKBP-type peptidyl-prolyl cis-trans isomerase [Brumimicrobium mesophilum]|uniref:FKBP-type peptidyl-prolyl cis-trans isomerase n=1 Tax=Brumimicrobium mesophilum TaxID=392717 RepID=UPI000D13EDFB|nr:FKBP-type peptidyl-prolyl cis-trans isomerase [Brumimicrobium mesophilum]
MRWIGFILLLASISSCTTYSDNDLESFDQKIQKYIDSTGLDMEKTENGLYYSILEEGEGEEFIKYKDQVTFHYKGSFLTGNTFQVIDENDPLSFKVNQLIIGWQDGLMMLKKGGRIHLIIPPQLGYADKSSDVIPTNTILEYKLTVLDVQ